MLCKFTANCTIGGGAKRRICAICTSVLLTALIMTFTVLALSISASAEQSGDGWTFDETTGALTVTTNDGTTNWRRLDTGTPDWRTAKRVEIKDGVTQIKIGAFSGCINLTSVSLPEGIVSIGGTAFYECSSLTSIILPESLKKIGNSAFDGCSSLTSVLIPTNIDKYGIAVDAFKNCTSLKTLFIPDCFNGTLFISVSGQTAMINYNLNDGNFNITNIDLRNGMTEVELPDTIDGKDVKIPKELMKDVTHTHEGGAATCTQKAECTLCGLEYGELAAHTLVKTEAVSPTCTAAGNDEYWTCSVCQKMFADGSGTAEITEIPTIAALPHTGGTASCTAKAVCDTCGQEYGELAAHNFVNGVCTVCNAADPNYTTPTETTVTEDTTETEPTETTPEETASSETTPAETEPTGTVPTSPTGTSPSVPSRPSYPAPAVTTAVTTITTVTTVVTTTAEEEIIQGDYTGEDVGVDAAVYSEDEEIGGRVFCAALIYITIFAGLAIAVKKLRP